MKVEELLLEDNAQTVLVKMATTIDPNVSSLNGYTNRSCFGRVAHYLKAHTGEPSWYILLFGFKNNGEVTHCCLYSNDGERIVDTFDGEPRHTVDGIVYIDVNGNEHELLASITLQRFQDEFLS